MIEHVMQFIRDQINLYLYLKTGLDDRLVLSNLTDKDGKLLVSSLALTLVNIEEERLVKNQPYYKETPQGTLARINPAVMLNLYVLFSANFGDNEVNYRESLKFISYVISFFQVNQSFTPQSHPVLDSRIEKLVPELCSTSFEQLNYLWGSLGTKYLPSALYKVRLIAIQEDQVQMEAPPITEAKLTV